MRITHSERMAVETEEQREARLQRMRTKQSDRLAAKTKEQREARLQRMCANQSGTKALTFICNFKLSVYTRSEHLLSTYVDCIMIL